MVVFLDRTITLSSTAFEYNFGVNTQFYANLINAIPGQGFGPVVIMRVYAKGRGYEDVEIPYGTPIVQLHGYGNKVTFSGSGAQIQITLSSTPIPLSATDIGQAQLYAQAAQPPVVAVTKTWQAATASAVSPAISVEENDFIVVLALADGTAINLSDNQGSTFTGISTPQGTNVYYAANLKASSNYTITGFEGVGALVVLRGVAITAAIDNSTGVSANVTAAGNNNPGASNNVVLNAVNEMAVVVAYAYAIDSTSTPDISSIGTTTLPFSAPSTVIAIPGTVVNGFVGSNGNTSSFGYQILGVPRRFTGTSTSNPNADFVTLSTSANGIAVVTLVVLG